MKILLASLNARYTHTCLAIRYLEKTLSDQDNLLVSLAEWTINDPLLAVLAEVVSYDADILAFSCYIWNSRQTIDLICALKQIRPQAIIVLGGPEAATKAADWLKRYEAIDFIIRGEGEKSLGRLVESLQAENKDFSTISGLAFRSDGVIRLNKEDKPLLGDQWPFPYSVAELKNLSERTLYYESSRGCIFRCSYCLSSTGGPLVERSLDLVLVELDRFIAADVRLVKLVDRTFNSNKERARAIWQHLLERYKTKPYRTQFHFEVAGDLFDLKTIELLTTAPPRLIRLEIGVQSIHAEVLKKIRRTSRIDKIVEAVRRLKQNDNLTLHLDLIAGLPGETWELFAKSFDRVIRLKPDMLQLGFLKLLPGTPIVTVAGESGYRWLEQPPYEVLESDALSFSQLVVLKHIEKLLDLYYHNRACRGPVIWLADLWPDPFSFYLALAGWFKDQGLFERSLGIAERCQQLYQFGLETGKLSQVQVVMFLDLIRTSFQLAAEKGQPAWLNFLVQRSDQESQSLVRTLQQTGPGSRSIRFDRILFDWRFYLETGALRPADQILKFRRVAQGVRLEGLGEVTDGVIEWEELR